MTKIPELGRHAVVVGVDGSDESTAALRWALEHRDPDQTVHAVTAYQVPGEGVVYPGLRVVDEDIEAAERAALHKNLTDALGPDYAKQVTADLVYGVPKRVMRDLSGHAEQVVVGAQGHNAVLDGALGSISAYLVAHADCPVTVVRSPASAA